MKIDNHDVDSLYPHVFKLEDPLKPRRKLPKVGRLTMFFWGHPKLASNLQTIWAPIGICLFWLLLPLWVLLARFWLKANAAFFLENVYGLFKAPWSN